MNSLEQMTDKKRHFEFRVVAGSLKGKKITAPDLGITRPPLTRLRKSIFDFLQPYLLGRSYLDLFSGTGSYLFEAASRGVTSATGIELEHKLVSSINKQADAFDIRDTLTCLQQDVFKAIPSLAAQHRTFDIIMIAPPQYRQLINQTLVSLAQHRIYDEESLILCQHDTSETKDIDFSGFEINQQRKYGNTTYTVLTMKL